jgi:hypothetical protein
MKRPRISLARDDPETLYSLYYEASKALAKLGRKLKAKKKNRK